MLEIDVHLSHYIMHTLKFHLIPKLLTVLISKMSAEQCFYAGIFSWRLRALNRSGESLSSDLYATANFDFMYQHERFPVLFLCSVIRNVICVATGRHWQSK